MQLILETEATADISVKMSTVEESLDINLKESIESLKNDICNGNKENIECQKNIISNVSVDDIDGDHKENETEVPSSTEDVNLELEMKKDGSRKEESSNGNSYENSNSLHNTDNMNGDGPKCEENNVEGKEVEADNDDSMNGDGPKYEESNVEEKEAEAESILVNDTDKLESEEISLSSKEDISMDAECENAEEKDDIYKEENSNNTDGVTKVINILATELEEQITKTDDSKNNSEEPVEDLENEKSQEANQVDEDISEMAMEVDKTISEMAMQIDEDILDDADSVDGNVSEEAILVDEVQSENVASETKDAVENAVQIETDRDVEVVPEDIVDLDLANTDKNESETVVPIAPEQNKTDTVTVDEITDDNDKKTIDSVLSEQSELDNKALSKKDEKESETAVMDSSSVQSEAGTEIAVDKTEDNDLPTVVASEQNEKTKTKDERETEKMDDHVIQIESEQDGEVLHSVIEKSENDATDLPEKVVKDNANDDLTITEAETSITVANESSEVTSDKIDCDLVADELIHSNNKKEEVLNVHEVKVVTEVSEPIEEPKVATPSQSVKVDEPKKSNILKLSNTLDILSDDEEDQPQTEPQKTTKTISTEKQCINIEDDDDIMVIDDDTDLSKDIKTDPVTPMETEEKKEEKTSESAIDLENREAVEVKKVDATVAEVEKDPVVATPEVKSPSKPLETTEPIKEAKEEVKAPLKPLLPENFLKSCKKNLADMTRDELEEFCILKIVESIVDRSNLGEIKSKLKTMAQNIEEHKKKAMMLTKQNRDLQLVLKSVQEEQKKKPDSAITPLKITRSVGMQVLMTEKIGARKKPVTNNIIPLAPPMPNRNIRTPSPRVQKPAGNQQIPVPRLVPAAANPVAKSPMTQNSPISNQVKGQANQFNGARMSPPVQKAEKRPHNRIQSVTVDLTDDEPPSKVTPRSSPAPPVRLVSPQNLLSNPRPQLTTSVNSPRKVYIPISGPQGQNIRPGQTIMLKSVPTPGPRQRGAVPNMTRGPSPNVIKRVQNNRHPAPLPDALKQYQPPNWKALPPAPDLKLSKVENGIVISWKIEGYQEDSYEEIASYQLFAYQETSSPPSTALWKKIGDVKALPLPMACTLTQFMAGFKYYFAVRAVDVRSRLGPFSLPGSILLLNKM
ncbi:hypothetical protein ABMA27_004203 [Loxostege sticticalis]|uniref:Activating transcription factor 7-interacting protein Fn3 domain-containing protein n=1 Tax=Loxostege sticticalis TaxID=481309 RepID=A0ABR3HMP9_LOXSC